MSMRLSATTNNANAGGPQITPLYDRQYMTLHSLLEKEMRNRVESEKMIRDDMTQNQDQMARICNQIQEVASDLKANLPRLFQETKELRRETQHLTAVYQANVNEMTKLTEAIASRTFAVDQRFERIEQQIQENQDRDTKQKTQIWDKLCLKAVVQELADKVGCLDLEAHAKITERKEDHQMGMQQVADLEKKVQSALEEFLRGLNKCDFLYGQCAEANTSFKKASEKVAEDHRELIDNIVFPRVERCEGLLNQEMCERVECLKKIAHELVHSKEQTDKIKDQLERLGIDLANAQAASTVLAAAQEYNNLAPNLSPLDRSLQQPGPGVSGLFYLQQSQSSPQGNNSSTTGQNLNQNQSQQNTPGTTQTNNPQQGGDGPGSAISAVPAQQPIPQQIPGIGQHHQGSVSAQNNSSNNNSLTMPSMTMPTIFSTVGNGPNSIVTPTLTSRSGHNYGVGGAQSLTPRLNFSVAGLTPGGMGQQLQYQQGTSDISNLNSEVVMIGGKAYPPGTRIVSAFGQRQ